MLKNMSNLELILNNRTYTFSCENQSPISDVKECLFQFQKYVGQIEDQAKALEQIEKTAAAENTPTE